MKLQFLLVCSVAAGLYGLQAEHPKHLHKKINLTQNPSSVKKVKNKEHVFPEPGNLKLEVKGVVCSFCAYGLTKKFSKLGFVDKKKFGGSGVYTDIEKGSILLALKKGRRIDFKKLKESILSGGYVLVRILVNLKGELSILKNKTIFLNQDSTQKFVLLDKGKKKFLPRRSPNKKINIKGEVLNLKKKYAQDDPTVVVVEEYQGIR